MKIRHLFGIASLALATSCIAPLQAWAQSDQKSEFTPSQNVQDVYNKLTDNAKIKKGLEFIKTDADKTLSQQVEMTEIPAPSNHEQEKAAYFKKKLQKLGLKNVHVDDTGNVIGTYPGSENAPVLVLSAHLDIVFEQGVDTTVTKKDGKLYAPGIEDDDGGLAALLSVARALNESGIETIGDIVFVGTVGEEDDFRGVDALFKQNKHIDGFISVDGADVRTVKHGGTSGYTIRFKFHGPGGHSFGNYQRPSAVHAMGRAIAKISHWGKQDPKTTFNVGIVKGGTAENAKAEEASMLMEFRTDGDNVEMLKQRLFEAVREAVNEENEKWGCQGSKVVSVDHHVKVQIPGGTTPRDASIVQSAAAATTAIGKQPAFSITGMTDANYSHGAGVPGITLGSGGKAGNAHSLQEWYDPTNAYLGPQKIYLTVLGLVGVKGLTEPLLNADPHGSQQH